MKRKKKKKKKKKKQKKKKNSKNWSANDEFRHPVPKTGYAFNDRKRDLKDKQDRSDMDEYR